MLLLYFSLWCTEERNVDFATIDGTVDMAVIDFMQNISHIVLASKTSSKPKSKLVQFKSQFQA